MTRKSMARYPKSYGRRNLDKFVDGAIVVLTLIAIRVVLWLLLGG